MEMRKYEYYFHQKHGDIQRQRATIKKVLAGGPSTISGIHESTKLPTDLLVWNLVGMIRWGEVEVVGEDEHELIYELKEV
jgi:hypothetical protein